MRQLPKSLIGGGATGLAVVPSAIAHGDPADGRYLGHSGMMGWGGWVFGPLMMLVFAALLIGAVVLIVRLLGAEKLRPGPKDEGHAQAILRERFAKGEISREEYEESRRVLDGGKS